MNKKFVSVIGFRHGEKTGDALTPAGAAQIFQSASGFRGQGIQAIYHSGADRTRQSALIAQAALKLWDIPIIENPGFHFKIPSQKAFNGDEKAFDLEVKEIKKAGGTVREALKMSQYAKLAQKQLIETIARAVEDNAFEPFMFFSHSPYVNLGADHLPYEIETAAAIHYVVSAGEIRAAKHIPLF